ncbi:hypothetical protein LCGC14_1355720 [marine sediment metagenome]|uniref:Carbon storage regulator n=1 Tax=marine sediment metagenome TaxID=412755 RepID=A0A0F9NBW9_9ZZZZ
MVAQFKRIEIPKWNTMVDIDSLTLAAPSAHAIVPRQSLAPRRFPPDAIGLWGSTLRFTETQHTEVAMLVLSRKQGEVIRINDDVTIMVLSIVGDKVRLGVEAPRHIPVHRGEVYAKIKRAEKA